MPRPVAVGDDVGARPENRRKADNEGLAAVEPPGGDDLDDRQDHGPQGEERPCAHFPEGAVRSRPVAMVVP